MCMTTKTGNRLFRIWDGIFKEEKKKKWEGFKKKKN